MLRPFLVLALVLFGPALWGAPVSAPPAPPAESLSDILAGLKDIEGEMTLNQDRIESLQTEITQLQSLGKSAEGEIERLQTLVEEHAARVKQLGDRYSAVLVLAQKLKKDLEWSATLNYVFGGTALVAVLVAVGEGIALAGR